MTKNINYALSNKDLNDFISQADKKGVNIFKCEDIKGNTDIERIFDNRGHAIIHHGSNNMGHWLTMLRTPCKKVFFIDSFAENSDYYNKHIKECMKNNGIKEYFINNTKLQDVDSVTCGSYGIILVTMHKLGYTPNETIDFIINGSKEQKGQGKNKYKNIDKFMHELTKKI